MRNEDSIRVETRDSDRVATPAAWQAPGFESVSLACEISAYAPDSGDPLF